MTALNQFLVTDQVAVVTGALGKLGALWVKTLLDAGGKVAALDLPGAQPSADFLALQAHYGADRLRVYGANVCDRESLGAACTQIEQTLGPVAILVNNAGIDQPPGQVQSWDLAHIPVERFESVLEVNVTGAFLCMQVFGGAMATSGYGRIINIGSLYASVSPDARFYDHLDCDPPFLKPPAYGASKAALHNLTGYFATHWGAKGVTVNTLSPGGVEGGQDPAFKAKFCARVPLGRMATLEDLSGPLLFLASGASAYVTGSHIRVDGGFTAW